ncbi:MAG: hypothetical protein XXXJIFNMEKO3_01423 [Candidatus Erwinia impunctatus]|nr:hypothetical protein XXXJIFNMEKO_01423 [Culicoides impunctatus]
MEGLSFSLVSMFIGLLISLWFASQQKYLETLNIAIAVLVTLFAAEHADLSVVVIVAASLSATLATLATLLLLARQNKQGKPDAA